MNERIRELAEQAGFRPYMDLLTGEVDHNGYLLSTPNWETLDPAVIRFAELIVAECAEVAKDFVTTANNKLVEKIHIFPWSLQDKIKEHFGVEE